MSVTKCLVIFLSVIAYTAALPPARRDLAAPSNVVPPLAAPTDTVSPSSAPTGTGPPSVAPTGAVPPSAAPNQPSFLTGTQTGDGTFYSTGLGACGIKNTDTDFIAAVSHDLFDNFPGKTDNPNGNPVCNRKVRATYQGKSVEITVTDRCEACNVTDLDFSPSAFNTLSDPSVGRLHGMTWVWI